MEKKRKLKQYLFISSLSLLLLFMVGKTQPYPSFASSEHDSSCYWNHYLRIEPTLQDNGCKEYYACCNHHTYSFSMPSEGNISSPLNQSYLFSNSLDENDERIILSYQKQINALENKINELYAKDNVTFDDYFLLNECNYIYNSFSDEYQKLVSNYDYLGYVETVFDSKFVKLASGKDLSFSNREYGSTFDVSTSKNEFDIETVKLSNISGVSTFWIYPNLNVDLNEYSSINLYFKSSFDVSLEYRLKTNYSKINSFSCRKDEWALINIDTNQIDLLSDIGFAYCVNDGEPFKIDGSFEFMPIFGTKKDSNSDYLLVDASEDDFRNNDYACDFEVSHIIDGEKGTAIKISNISTDKEWVWFKPSVNFNVSLYKFVYFYFKSDVASTIEIKETSTGCGNLLSKLEVDANSWYKIVVPVNASSFPSYNINNLGIAKYSESGHSISSTGNWYISSIYGVLDSLPSEYEILDGYCIPKFSKENDFNISAYAMVNINQSNADLVLSDAKNAGFNKIISLYDGRNATLESSFIEALKDYTGDLIKKEAKKKVLLESIDSFCLAIKENNVFSINKANQYGMKYVALISLIYDFESICSNNKITVSDSLYLEIMNRFLSNIDYSEEIGFDGIFLKDEPDVKNDFSRYQSFINSYLNTYKLKGIPFINLLPLGDDGNAKKYNTYLNNYFDKIYPLLNYASFDQYPMKIGGTTIDNHLYNLSLFASRIKSSGTNGRLKTFIHSTLADDETYDIAGISSSFDLKYQMYSNMAFGSKDIAYFVYSSNSNPDDGLVNFKTFEKTKLYEYAKVANDEINSFADAYSYFDFDGVYTYGECSQFDLIENKLSSIDDFSLLSKDNNVLVSKFNKQNQNAYLLLNYVNPQSGGKNNINLQFDSKYNFVLSYLNGEKKLIKNNGNLTFNLEKGSAAFLIPLTL